MSASGEGSGSSSAPSQLSAGAQVAWPLWPQSPRGGTCTSALWKVTA